MARIKVKDLSRDQKIGREELKRLSGGYGGYFFDGLSGKLTVRDNKSWSDLMSFSPRSIKYRLKW
jgi:hypothetical protein